MREAPSPSGCCNRRKTTHHTDGSDVDVSEWRILLGNANTRRFRCHPSIEAHAQGHLATMMMSGAMVERSFFDRSIETRKIEEMLIRLED